MLSTLPAGLNVKKIKYRTLLRHWWIRHGGSEGRKTGRETVGLGVAALVNSSVKGGGTSMSTAAKTTHSYTTPTPVGCGYCVQRAEDRGMVSTLARVSFSMLLVSAEKVTLMECIGVPKYLPLERCIPSSTVVSFENVRERYQSTARCTPHVCHAHVPRSSVTCNNSKATNIPR